VTGGDQSALMAQLALIIVPLGTALAAVLTALAAWLKSSVPSRESQAEQTAMMTDIKGQLDLRRREADERHKVTEAQFQELKAGHVELKDGLAAVTLRLDHQDECIDGLKKLTRATGEAVNADMPTELKG
jgi:hypothetical protein